MEMDIETTVNKWVDGAAKPKNSLGLLEKYAKKVALSWGQIYKEVRPYHLVFAADNGVVAEGVAQDPTEITFLQAQNMVAGKATISCFCKYNQIPFSVVDIGINTSQPFNGIQRKVAMGTKNFMQTEAMTCQEFDKAWQVGEELVGHLVTDEKHNLLSFGEMGIGNTTTSAAVLHALTGILPEFVAGYGASANNNEVLKRKRMVVAKGVERHKDSMKNVRDILRCVGGFDMVGICAGMLACSKLHVPFVIDGFITAVAYACAARIHPGIEKNAIPSHMSREPGMAYSLLLGNILAEDVMLRGDMALGEGTGAVLMVCLLKTMLYTLNHMASYSEMLSLNSCQEETFSIL